MSVPNHGSSSIHENASLVSSTRTSLVHRYLDPATSLAEILFGLIMTLTFTLGAGLLIEEGGRAGVRELLVAVIGCNIAWGIIDGALYLTGQLFDRGRMRRLGRAIRIADSPAAAIALVRSEMEPLLSNLLPSRETHALYVRVAQNIVSTPEEETSIKREDWLGAAMSFLLVFLSGIPAAIPFLLIDDARLALRVSNAVLVSLLFITGYWWARYTVSKPALVGTAFMVIGIALVVAAIALGG